MFLWWHFYGYRTPVIVTSVAKTCLRVRNLLDFQQTSRLGLRNLAEMHPCTKDEAMRFVREKAEGFRSELANLEQRTAEVRARLTAYEAGAKKHLKPMTKTKPKAKA